MQTRRRSGPSSKLLALAILWRAATGGDAYAATPGQGDVNVYTYQYSNARTGVNARELELNPKNVSPATFGKLFSVPVDGEVYAQPLYLSGVAVKVATDRDGRAILKRRNVVFVATQHDSVYALDADVSASPYWHRTFVHEPDVTTVPFPPPTSPQSLQALECYDIVPEAGITGTPVIDVEAGVLYVVTKTSEASREPPFNRRYVQRLHALSVSTGDDLPHSPVEIAATAPGSGNGVERPADDEDKMKTDNDGHGNVVFDPLHHNQRAGLLLVGDVVYISWGAHGDQNPFHGWMLGYDKRTLELVSYLVTTPDGGHGGIYQGGAAPTADADGFIYLMTGDGTFDANVAKPDEHKNYGDCILKLQPDRAAGRPSRIRVVDYFTPNNQADLLKRDRDLGSGGVIVLPGQGVGPKQLLAGAGKDGTIFLLDSDHLGGFDPGDSTYKRIIQAVPSVLGRKYGSGAFFNGALYIGGGIVDRPRTPGDGDSLKQFPLRNGKFELPLKDGKFDLPTVVTSVNQTKVLFKHPGTNPCVSSNGTDAGIVWTIQAEVGLGSLPTAIAVLHAFDASDLSKPELYNTEQAMVQGRKQDQPGVSVKFTVPTVANGKVYVGTRSELTVYGLFPQARGGLDPVAR